MDDDILGKLKARIENSDTIKGERRREMLDLLNTLKSEVGSLSKTQPEKAESIAGFTELSTREATRADRNPKLLNLSLEGLKSSVEEFEETHPRLVQIVNSISST